MPEPTPEAWAQIRHDYEHTDRPLAHICAEHSITVPMMRYRMKRWEWRRRKPLIPHQGPPPVPPSVIPGRGPQAASPESITPAAAYGFRARVFDASRNDEVQAAFPQGSSGPDAASPAHLTPAVFAAAQIADRSPPGEGEENAPATIVPRLQGAVARVLPAIEATIARLASGAHHPRGMEQASRTLGALTRALRELNVLLAQHNARLDATYPYDDDRPKDLDAFRFDLARRIEAFVASRTNEDGAQPGSELEAQK